MNSHVATIQEVEQFFKYIVEERHIMFHPDDDFEVTEGLSKEEVTIWNNLLRESWNVCVKENVDISSICLPLAFNSIAK